MTQIDWNLLWEQVKSLLGVLAAAGIVIDISVHDDYAMYVEENKIQNGQVKLAYEYIAELYRHCCEKNSFLVVRPSDEEEEE